MMNESKRFCVECKATKTPMWRSGPLGPRSLCNACGIRYRKRKIMEDYQKPSSDIRKEKLSSAASTTKPADDHHVNEEFSNHLGHQLIIPTSSSSSSSSSSSNLMVRENNRSSKSKRKLGEVEEAAVLLMSLSCGSVFA